MVGVKLQDRAGMPRGNWFAGRVLDTADAPALPGHSYSAREVALNILPILNITTESNAEN